MSGKRAPVTDSPKPQSALPLKVFHALVFGSFAAAVLAATWHELLHLSRAVGRPFHHGDPPMPLAMAATAIAVACTVRLLVGLPGARSTPLWPSLGILAAGALAVISANTSLPQQRTAPGANLQILSSARKLHAERVALLQQRGEITRDLRAWDEVLARVAPREQSPVRNRVFSRVPYQLVAVSSEDQPPPEPRRPGMIALYVSEDGATFSLWPVGFDSEGRAQPLLDDKGERITLRGTYNPDALDEPASSSSRQELQPLIRP